MAWLEDLAKGARIASLGKLAKAAVDHADWPEGETSNARSIENLLRFVDQKKKKGQVWLDNRPEVKQVLADLLGVGPESLDPGSIEPDGPADPRVELKELREARPIDLRNDDLYPGIPEEVLDPSQWGRSWWLAYAGAGKTLVGKWLEARRLATFLRGDRLADVIPRVPATGAVYIELALPDSTDAARWAEDLDGRDVCVAAPFLPVPLDEVVKIARVRQEWDDRAEEDREDEKPELAAGWDWIKTPPKDEWVEDLIQWVGGRMREGGGFEVDAVLELVRGHGWDSILATPGDYIGVCGLFEEMGAQRLKKCSAADALATFLESRLERPDLGGPRAWSAKDLSRLVSGCVEAAMINSGTEDTFTSEQALKMWLPADSLPEGNDAVLRQLVETPPADMHDVQAVLGRARPSADSAIRELFRLHLLEPIGEGAVVLRPSWLALIAAMPAMERLVADPDRGLGRLLLRPKAAKWPLSALRDAFLPDDDDDPTSAPESTTGELGWSVVKKAVAGVRVEDPASVALLEATFQAAGLALLDAEVPARLLELRALWDAQMSLALPRYNNAPPQPRIFQIEREAKGWESAWYVAALAISERLVAAGDCPPIGALAPWGAEALPEFMDQTFSGLQNVCVFPLRSGSDGDAIADPPDFVVDAWRLAGRLYRSLGIPADNHQGQYVFAPFALFDAMKRCDVETWHGRLAYDYELDALAELAEDEGLAIGTVLAALWRAQNVSRQPVFLPTDRFSAEWQTKIWRALPPDVLATTLAPWIQHGHGMAWDLLTAEHWDVVLKAWRENPMWERRGLEHLPERYVRTLIRERLAGVMNGYRVYGVLWAQFPEICIEETVRDLVGPVPDGAPDGVVWRVPGLAVQRIVEQVRPHLPAILDDPAARLQLMRWAHIQCSARGPHWMSAWYLLTEVEPRREA